MANKKQKKDSSSYKNSSEYKALTSDEKKLADLYSSVTSGTSKYTSSQLKAALKKAKKDSSGYMTQVLREYEMTVSQQVASETGDYQSHLDTINENIKEINDDLAKNKDYLSLEEQQTLAKQARDYEQQRGDLQSQIASTGTTFSTSAENQKSYAAETNKGIVESTTASYDKQRKDLEDAAARGNIQAKQQLADLDRTHQQNINSIGLKAESYLGTDKLKDVNIAGYTPLGNISGQYKEDTVTDIQKRQQAYLDDSKQASLNF